MNGIRAWGLRIGKIGLRWTLAIVVLIAPG